jgi:hypothetical protein
VKGHVISGRVMDPLGLRPPEAILTLGVEDNGGFSAAPIQTQADGSFVTPQLRPATYVLQVVRTPHSPTQRATVVGLTIVPVTTADVTGVTVVVRRDTALKGRFRMESDNPAAPRPKAIIVNAYLALDGAPLLNGTVAEGAPGGRFVLRNAFGPQVVRPGYMLSGASWWPTRILLDGADITNVPTDFSKHQDGELEVVFTQHPARFEGTVRDREGRPAPRAWVLLCAADRNLWQAWATTSQAVRADANGVFRLTSLPGRYHARALAPSTFLSRSNARQRAAQLAPGGLAVELGERELKTFDLVIREP